MAPKCKCGTRMVRELWPDRNVCLICGRSEWLNFKMRKGVADGKVQGKP